MPKFWYHTGKEATLYEISHFFGDRLQMIRFEDKEEKEKEKKKTKQQRKKTSQQITIFKARCDDLKFFTLFPSRDRIHFASSGNLTTM